MPASPQPDSVPVLRLPESQWTIHFGPDDRCADISAPTCRDNKGLGTSILSDGVIEATAPSTRELFGCDRAAAVSRGTAQAIAAAARHFGHGVPQADDITVLTLTRTPASVAVPA